MNGGRGPLFYAAGKLLASKHTPMPAPSQASSAEIGRDEVWALTPLTGRTQAAHSSHVPSACLGTGREKAERVQQRQRRDL